MPREPRIALAMQMGGQSGGQFQRQEQRLIMTPRIRRTVDKGSVKTQTALPPRRKSAKR